MKPSIPLQTEIDKRVAQELKNNREFIYQTNQALQNLFEGLKSMTLMHQKEMAALQSLHKSLEIDFTNLSEDLNAKIRKAFSSLGDLRDDLGEAEQEMRSNVKRLDTDFLDLKKVEGILTAIVDKQYNLDTSHQELSDHIDNCHRLMKGEIRSETDSLRKSLAPDEELPSKMEEKTKELLRPFYVDFDALALEIARLRKEVDYSKKQFEYLNTQINRLKEGNS